jgi:predicted dehydrogenase
VSCSYGPGRYDDDYENKGIDYPLPFVRWTEKRNFETVLQTIASGTLNVTPLITEVVELEQYDKIYGEIGTSKSIASILKYKEDNKPVSEVQVSQKSFDKKGEAFAVVGAGNFTKMTMMPALKKAKAPIASIVSSGGVSGTDVAKKYEAGKSSTDYANVLKDPAVGMVIITTRHDLHAEMTLQALKADKHVFVEKPLALSRVELDKIVAAQQSSGMNVTVGFNRRFSPHIQAIKKNLGGQLMNVTATMNAGFIPSSVWVHDLKVGGGRIVGEACHFIDLLVYLTGSKVTRVCMNALGQNPEENTDNASILLQFENGSNGVVNYFSNGSKSYAKERLEVFSQEKIMVMDNFRKTKGYGIKGFSGLKTKQDKGHNAQFAKLTEFLKTGGSPLIPFDEIVNVTKASFAAIESLKKGSWVNVE